MSALSRFTIGNQNTASENREKPRICYGKLSMTDKISDIKSRLYSKDQKYLFSNSVRFFITKKNLISLKKISRTIYTLKQRVIMIANIIYRKAMGNNAIWCLWEELKLTYCQLVIITGHDVASRVFPYGYERSLI